MYAIRSYYDDIIFVMSLGNKLYVTFQSIDNIKHCNLPGRFCQFIAAVFAAGTFNNACFNEPIEYLLQKLVWNTATRSDS